MTPPLPVRLFGSHLLVVGVGVVAAYLTVRWYAPTLFEHRVGGTVDAGHPGMGQGTGRGVGAGQGRGLRAAFVSALNTALWLGVVVSAVAAGALAVVMTRYLVRPLDAVRTVTRSIAAGRYETRVAIPREPELAGLARDVNTLAAALADIETRRVRLLGEVAHEMRTPLTVLDGYVEGMIDGVFTAEPATLEALSEELRRLHRLAEDLSALSRAEEGVLRPRRERLDLAELAHGVAARLSSQFSDAGVSLVVRAPDSVAVSGDGDRLAQVVTNLLGNALVATPAPGTVTVTVSLGPDHALLTVGDTGVGLAEADTERIFDRFYRVPGVPRRSSGSGIGLTIARSIVRAHGGELTAASAGPGRGATFTMRLPSSSDTVHAAR